MCSLTMRQKPRETVTPLLVAACALMSCLPGGQLCLLVFGSGWCSLFTDKGAETHSSSGLDKHFQCCPVHPSMVTILSLVPTVWELNSLWWDLHQTWRGTVLESGSFCRGCVECRSKWDHQSLTLHCLPSIWLLMKIITGVMQQHADLFVRSHTASKWSAVLLDPCALYLCCFTVLAN